MWKMINILIGTFNNIFNKNKKISIPRMKICKDCEYIKKINKIGNVCTICGCILESKTTVLNEKCNKGKW